MDAAQREAWDKTLVEVHQEVRSHILEYAEAGRWLDSEYSEQRCRELRSAAEGDAVGIRASAHQIHGSTPEEDARYWRLRCVVTDFHVDPPDLRVSAVHGEPALWARRVLLVAALVSDPKASEYAAGLTDLANLPWLTDPPLLCRVNSTPTDFNENWSEPWIGLIRMALRRVRSDRTHEVKKKRSSGGGSNDTPAEAPLDPISHALDMQRKRKQDVEARLLSNPIFQQMAKGSSAWEEAQAAANAAAEPFVRAQKDIERANGGRFPLPPEAGEQYRALSEAASQAYLKALEERGHRLRSAASTVAELLARLRSVVINKAFDLTELTNRPRPTDEFWEDAERLRSLDPSLADLPAKSDDGRARHEALCRWCEETLRPREHPPLAGGSTSSLWFDKDGQLNLRGEVPLAVYLQQIDQQLGLFLARAKSCTHRDGKVFPRDDRAGRLPGLRVIWDRVLQLVLTTRMLVTGATKDVPADGVMIRIVETPVGERPLTDVLSQLTFAIFNGGPNEWEVGIPDATITKIEGLKSELRLHSRAENELAGTTPGRANDGGDQKAPPPQIPASAKIDGWTKDELCRQGQIKSSTFDRICDAAQVTRARRGVHGFRFGPVEVEKLAAKAEQAEGKRKWRKVAARWREYLRPPSKEEKV